MRHEYKNKQQRRCAIQAYYKAVLRCFPKKLGFDGERQRYPYNNGIMRTFGGLDDTDRDVLRFLNITERFEWMDKELDHAAQ